ncbi:DUF6236 family protein [Sphingomonas sp. DT-51]|uniref:DUF6236 family protein n=1 Tax=Sphingomonas sp. DT-51 TaxID=3396165 RepID=UPI003F1AD16C
MGLAAEIGRSESNSINFTGRPSDPGVIKVALLFVDKLDKPDNNIIGTSEEVDIELASLGLGQQSRASFSQGLSYDQMANYAWEVYKHLEKRDAGQWSLWPQYDNYIVPKAELHAGLAFQIELQNSIVVPSVSTPYEDLLSFKERHRDELVAVRFNLEEMAIKLSNEGDIRSIKLEREKFDVALADYLAKARESNISKAVASLKAELDWATAVRSVVTAGGTMIAAQHFDLTKSAAAVATGLVAGLSIKSVAGRREGPSPFRYLARIEREFGG